MVRRASPVRDLTDRPFDSLTSRLLLGGEAFRFRELHHVRLKGIIFQSCDLGTAYLHYGGCCLGSASSRITDRMSAA